MSVELLRQRLDQGEAVVLDGGLGTEVNARGVTFSLPLWSAGALLHETGQSAVQEVHEANIAAGADIIITGTFRTQPYVFNKVGEPAQLARTATLAAGRLASQAREAIGKPEVVVAASVGPLEDCYRPQDTPHQHALWQGHLSHADNLAVAREKGDVDLWLPETMITLREARIALYAGEVAGFQDCAVSFCCDESGENLLSGEPLAHAVDLAEVYNAAFVGVNCVEPDVATRAVDNLTALTDLPIAVYAQGGEDPTHTMRKAGVGNYQRYYLEHARRWQDLGAQIIGGCCGVSPDYIADISQLIASKPQTSKLVP